MTLAYVRERHWCPDQPTVVTVEVPTETGQTAVIDIDVDPFADTYTLRISGALFDQAIEGVTASVQMAFLTLKASRERTK